jgi:hypothetical protein
MFNKKWASRLSEIREEIQRGPIVGGLYRESFGKLIPVREVDNIRDKMDQDRNVVNLLLEHLGLEIRHTSAKPAETVLVKKVKK